MPDHDRTGEILVHLQHLREQMAEQKEMHKETNAHLTKLNGRMGTVETDVAVLKATDPGRSGAKSGAIVSGAIAALIAAIAALLKALGVSA
jgi:hypothetical protein